MLELLTIIGLILLILYPPIAMKSLTIVIGSIKIVGPVAIVLIVAGVLLNISNYSAMHKPYR